MDKLNFFKRACLVLFIFLIITNSFWLWRTFHVSQENEAKIKEYNSQLEQFELISPEIAWLDVNSFLEKQGTYSLDYSKLKESLLNQTKISSGGKYGIYFQDLDTGLSIGINEKEKFFPQSLFKVPLMVVVLRKIQNGELALDTTIYLSKADLDSESGSLFKKGAGYPITIKELLEIMVKESDNTAAKALANRFLDESNYLEVTSIMGLPPPQNGVITVSPKEYSNLFRSLYYSNYLRRPFSEIALSIMAETDFKEQLSAGLPETVKISHKFGANEESGYYHDCGIIYLEKKGLPLMRYE